MFEKLEQIETKYEELTAQLALPEVLSDRSRYQKTVKAHRGLQGIVEKYRELKGVEKSISDTLEFSVFHPDESHRQTW